MPDIVTAAEETTIARIAWRGSLVAALLNAAGSPLELVVARGLPAMPRWPSLTAGAIGVALAGWLYARRRHPTRVGAAATMLINTAAVVTMLWLDARFWATLGPRWAPFQANKLGALTIGLLTPEIPVGLVCIAGYAGAAVAQWALFAPSVRAQLAQGEPVTTCIFAAFGVIILVVGARRYALERRLLAQQHEVAEMERLARTMLAVRDYANTPLQTIETATALARLQPPAADVQLSRIERALERLRGLNRILSRHEAHVRWRPGDESFDPVERLAGDDDADAGDEGKRS